MKGTPSNRMLRNEIEKSWRLKWNQLTNHSQIQKTGWPQAAARTKFSGELRDEKSGKLAS
jgi:hypothetical protein